MWPNGNDGVTASSIRSFNLDDVSDVDNGIISLSSQTQSNSDYSDDRYISVVDSLIEPVSITDTSSSETSSSLSN